MGEGSILAADFGSVTTRVVLFDVVDGEYRVVARRQTPTTAGAPYNDLAIALRRVLRDIGTAMGRTFMDAQGALITPEAVDRSGVDTFLATASVGRPMRAIMVGLLPEGSLRSALRAIGGAYVEVVGTLTLLDAPDEESMMNGVLLQRPDIVFIAGGTNGGPRASLLRLAAGIQTAVRVMDASIRPIVVFAGNRDVAPRIQEMFTDLTTVLIAANITPDEGVEALESAEAAVGQAYNLFKERFDRTYSSIGSLSATGILPTSLTLEVIAEFFARTHTGNVAVVDVGSASATIVTVMEGDMTTRMTPQVGLGHSARAMLETLGFDAVRAWLPLVISDGGLTNYVINKTLRPSGVPISLRELFIEHALLRAGVRYLVGDLRDHAPLDLATLIVCGAPLTGTGSAAWNLMLIADAIQPTGVTTVYADAYGVVPALGSMARVNPLAVVQLLDGGILDLLGTIISVDGQVRAERVLARLRIKTEGESADYELKGGQLLLLPLPVGYQITVEIRCQRGYSVGGKTSQTLTLDGSNAGILIDGRGRTFDAGSTVEMRARNLPQWWHSATDQAAPEIPADWLVPLPVEAKKVVPAPADRKGRRGKVAPAAQPLRLAEEDDLESLFGDTAPGVNPGKAAASALKKGNPPAATPQQDDEDVRGLF